MRWDKGQENSQRWAGAQESEESPCLSAGPGQDHSALKQSQSLVNACKILRTCNSAKCCKLLLRIDCPGMFGIIKTSPLDCYVTPAWYFYFFPPHFVPSQAKTQTISQPSSDISGSSAAERRLVCPGSCWQHCSPVYSQALLTLKVPHAPSKTLPPLSCPAMSWCICPSTHSQLHP